MMLNRIGVTPRVGGQQMKPAGPKPLSTRFGQNSDNPFADWTPKQLKQLAAGAVLGMGSLIGGIHYYEAQESARIAQVIEQQDTAWNQAGADHLRKAVVQNALGHPEPKVVQWGIAQIPQFETDAQRLSLLLAGIITCPKEIQAHQALMVGCIEDLDLKEKVQTLLSLHQQMTQPAFSFSIQIGRSQKEKDTEEAKAFEKQVEENRAKQAEAAKARKEQYESLWNELKELAQAAFVSNKEVTP
jgi:hypothetical protein